MGKISISLLRMMVGACFILLSMSCSGPMIQIDVSSAERLNLNKKQESLPVIVRIYQLSDKGVFESSTFNQLWKNDSKALSDTLLTKSEIVLNPSSEDTVELDRHSDAKYVGIVAIFRTPNQQKWRDVYELSSNFLGKRISSSFNVSLNGNSLHIGN